MLAFCLVRNVDYLAPRAGVHGRLQILQVDLISSRSAPPNLPSMMATCGASALYRNLPEFITRDSFIGLSRRLRQVVALAQDIGHDGMDVAMEVEPPAPQSIDDIEVPAYRSPGVAQTPLSHPYPGHARDRKGG